MIRQPIYHGNVNASGIFFPAPNNETSKDIDKSIDKDFAHFILSFWQQGIQLYRVSKGWVLLLNQTQVMNADHCRGYPLVKQSMGYSSAPLNESQLIEIGMETHSVVLIQGQQIQHFVCSSSNRIALNDWVDITAYSLLKAEHLGEDQPKSSIVNVADNVSAINGRTLFGEADYGSSQQAKEQLKTLQQEVTQHQQHQQRGTSLLGLALTIIIGVAGFLVLIMLVTTMSLPLIIVGLLLAFVMLLFRGKGHDQQQTQIPAQEQALKQQQQKPTSIAWVKRLFGNWLMSSQLGKLLGRQQAKYLQKTQAMFEKNNLQEALKHAIPLSDVNSLFQPEESPAFFGKLNAREHLDITTEQNTSSSSVSIGDAYEDLLRRTYRQAFHKLDRQKKYKDAAFVLAELLRETDEAVNYLEKHQQYTLAAELAEGRLLKPAVVVRQWILQGDFERALLIARQTGCYEQAVQLLEQKQQDNAQDKAKKLRLAWAVSLAKAGDYVKACDVIWPLAAYHELASGWIDRAMLVEGEAAARLLPRKLVLHPESYPQMIERVQDLISRDDSDSYQQRRVMIDALLELEKTPELQALAKCLSRRYLTDCTLGKQRWNKQRFKQLTVMSDDAVLRYDTRKLDFSSRRDDADEQATEKYLALDLQGTGEIYDIKPLGGNRYLIAHGEAGITLCRADGSVQRRFNVPAMQLVVADLQNRAIAIAHRGSAKRLSKLDLLTGKIEPWKEGYFSMMTDSYDGDTWLVAEHDRVYAMDMFSPELTAIWQIKDLPANVIYLQRTHRRQQSLNIIMATEHEAEYWRYELPSLTLRERQPIKQDVLEKVDLLDLNARGDMAFIRVEAQTMVVGIKDLIMPTRRYHQTFTIDGLQPISIHFEDARILICLKVDDTSGITEFWVIDHRQAAVDAASEKNAKGRVLVIRVSATCAVQATIAADQLIVYSDDGGVAVIDVDDGVVCDRFSV